MSADNGIYVLESKDGFRVIHTQCIENLWYWDDNKADGIELNPEQLLKYFGETKVIESQADALLEAVRLYNLIIHKVGVVEYGIVPITGWEDKEFPS